MDNLYELLPISVSNLLPPYLNEIRMRVSQPLFINDGKKWYFPIEENKRYIVSRADVDYVLGKASGYSMYAVNDSLIKGFLPWREGIRIGLAGEGVIIENGIHTLKNITSLAIRVPHEIKGKADDIMQKILIGKTVKSTLIISPTAAGKTTLLREIARVCAINGLNVAIIDERFEIAASQNGVPTLDVGGCTDVISGVGKINAYEMLIRSMNPDLIVTDEVYGIREIEEVCDAVRAGIKIAASVHGIGLDKLIGTEYEKLLDIFEIKIVLGKRQRAGEIVRIYENV